jgi:anti-sigma factor (TIGR02949 family)
MKCEETKELITALADHELFGEERTALESHLEGCPRCRQIYEQELALKNEVRLAGANLKTPADLREKILSDPRIFPTKARSAKGWKRLLWPESFGFRPAWAFALLIILLFPALYLLQPSGEAVALAALDTHRKILKGDISFARSEDEGELKARLAVAVERRFAPMGYDLSTMRLLPVGGMVQEVQGRKVLVVVYEGGGQSLTCYTLLGSEKDAPDHAALFFDSKKKMNFYAFSHGEMNGVLHREGDVICILVSKMPMSELLALARSKARAQTS